MSEEGDMLNALAGRMNEISSVVISQKDSINSLDRELMALKAGKSILPNYFGNKDQIIEELEAQGYGKKDEPGLQDDLHDAFRMFTEVTPEGRLVEGLQHGNRPASLMELYQTMDLRGLIWNYGLGWISAFKGGYNVGAESGKDNAKKFIDNVRKITQIPNSKELLENLKYSDELENYYKSREVRKADDLAAFYKIRKSVFNRSINGEKFNEKQAYFNLLKIKNDIKELKAQQPKPIGKIQRYWV